MFSAKISWCKYFHYSSFRKWTYVNALATRLDKETISSIFNVQQISFPIVSKSK